MTTTIDLAITRTAPGRYYVKGPVTDYSVDRMRADGWSLETGDGEWISNFDTKRDAIQYARDREARLIRTDVVAHAARDAAGAVTHRDRAIRAAHAAGATIRAIAAQASLSPSRIHQIVHHK